MTGHHFLLLWKTEPGSPDPLMGERYRTHEEAKFAKLAGQREKASNATEFKEADDFERDFIIIEINKP